MSTYTKNATRLIHAAKTWTSRDWAVAVDGLRHFKWQQKESTRDSTLAWSLLDRALREETLLAHRANTDTSTGMGAVEMLHGFVYSWSEAPTKISVTDMWNKLEAYKRLGTCPMISTYNIVLDVAIKLGEPELHVFAEHFLETIMTSGPAPDEFSFATVLNALAKSRAPDALSRAEVVFQSMKDTCGPPKQIAINTMITVCAHVAAAGRAEELLRDSPNPDCLTFSAVLDAWGNSTEADAPDRCYKAFQHMQHLYQKEGNIAARPDSVCYGTLIAAFAKKGRVQEAERVLQQQLDDYEMTKDSCVLPSRINFNAMMDAYAKKGAAKQAEALLHKMQTMANEMMNPDLFPDVISFTCVLNAYAKSNESSAAANAETILHRMEDLHQKGMSDVKPNLHSYSAVLACWAQTRSEQGAARAEAILRQMLQRSDSGEVGIRPNTVCFATVIDAVVKSRSRDAPERAEALLAEMERLSRNGTVEVNQHCFTTVITAWSQSRRREASSRAEELVERMKHMAKAGRHDMEPTMFTYCTLLGTYATTANAKKAHELLNRLCDDFVEGRSTLKPTVIAFSTVISAWARGGDQGGDHGIALLAEEVHRRMREFGAFPDASAFTALISAWAKSRDPRGPEKADFYLNELKRQYDAGDQSCKPNVIVYTSVINAWAVSNHPMAVQRASALLQEMKDEDASGNHECRPNSITYNSIIKCIARSRHTDKSFRASKVIIEMEERNIPPDITSFNSVLMACAFSSTHDPSNRTKAFKIALQMFQRAHKEAMPTRDTFCLLFQAAYGMGEDKEVEAAYHLCCRAGFQNDTLVRRDLKKTAPNFLNP